MAYYDDDENKELNKQSKIKKGLSNVAGALAKNTIIGKMVSNAHKELSAYGVLDDPETATEKFVDSIMKKLNLKLDIKKMNIKKINKLISKILVNDQLINPESIKILDNGVTFKYKDNDEESFFIKITVKVPPPQDENENKNPTEEENPNKIISDYNKISNKSWNNLMNKLNPEQKETINNFYKEEGDFRILDSRVLNKPGRKKDLANIINKFSVNQIEYNKEKETIKTVEKEKETING